MLTVGPIRVMLVESRVMILTAATRQDAVIHFVTAGANGNLKKFGPRNALLTAVLELAEDRLRVPDEAINRILAMVRGPHPSGDTRSADRLTQFEHETLTRYESVRPSHPRVVSTGVGLEM